MSQYYGLQMAYLLLNTVVLFIVTGLDCLMVVQARRKRLTAFLPWLVPSTIAAIASAVACMIRDIGVVLHFQPSAFWFLAEYVLGTVSILLMLVSVLRLWKIVNAFSKETGNLYAEGSSASGSNESIWPPPPTGSA